MKKIFFSFLMCCAYPAWSQILPGSADSSRIDPLQGKVVSNDFPQNIDNRTQVPRMKRPDGADQIRIFIEQIDLQGGHVFEDAEMLSIYAEYLNKEITLDKVWLIAEKITRYYRDKGYFLSRAYVPEQKIKDKKITIQIVEGYISDVKMDDLKAKKYALIQELIRDFKYKQPLRINDFEEFLLSLNNLPGFEFEAILKPVRSANSGKVQLVLTSAEEEGKLSVDVNNYGSRFLGPYQSVLTYRDSFLPFQETTLSTLMSLPTDELRYGALSHNISFAPRWSFNFYGSYINAEPGAALSVNNIRSNSIELGVSLDYQIVRLQQENLKVSFGISGQNTNGDIANNIALTRDRIRKVNFKIDYDVLDSLLGYNYFNVRLYQGIKGLGSSKKGDLFLSRAEADPEFTTAQFDYIRQQSINEDFMFIARVSGQLASDALYSAEEFGYGGQTFGRSYDNSEITGDHGVVSSIEVRYLNFLDTSDLRVFPYGFYDIGRVWNEDIGVEDASASSAGLGIRLNYGTALTSNLGLAWPLTKSIDNPLYGNGKNPRLMLQIGLEY